MAEWEKVVSVYDTADKAKSALGVLKTSGIDTSNVSLLDRKSFEPGVDQSQIGLWRRMFGENVFDHEASVYGEALKKGGAILAVRAPKDQVARIMSILDAHKPVDVNEAAARIGAGVPAEATTLATPPPGTTTPAEKEQVLRLAEEQLSVGKRMFETGTTRIRRFVTERPIEAKVTLHEEHAQIMRRAVSDPDYIADIDWSDREYTVTETAERPVVSKTARVVEEVVVRRQGSDHVETVRDTVRRQQAEVEKIDTTKVDTPKKRLA